MLTWYIKWLGFSSALVFFFFSLFLSPRPLSSLISLSLPDPSLTWIQSGWKFTLANQTLCFQFSIGLVDLEQLHLIYYSKKFNLVNIVYRPVLFHQPYKLCFIAWKCTVHMFMAVEIMVCFGMYFVWFAFMIYSIFGGIVNVHNFGFFFSFFCFCMIT